MKIITHRGNGTDFPENTLPALCAVAHENIDGVETDVQLTKDNVVVIHHDESLGRIFEGKEKIRNMTYAQLNNRKCLVQGYEDLRIPKLSEFLVYAKENQLFIHLEIKIYDLFHYRKLTKAVIEEVEKAQMTEQVAYCSFFYSCLSFIKKHHPDYPCNWLVERHIHWLTDPAFIKKKDGLHLKYQIYQELSEEEKDKLAALGPIRLWTIKRENQLEILRDKRIDALIANNPQEVKAEQDKLLAITEHTK